MATMLILHGMQLNLGTQPYSDMFVQGPSQKCGSWIQSGVVAPAELLGRLGEGGCFEF